MIGKVDRLQLARLQLYNNVPPSLPLLKSAPKVYSVPQSHTEELLPIGRLRNHISNTSQPLGRNIQMLPQLTEGTPICKSGMGHRFQDQAASQWVRRRP